MPKIYDNIQLHLLPDLREALKASYRADFCTGYFNLRGWSELGSLVDDWRGGKENAVRLLIGMHQLPWQERRALNQLNADNALLDNATKLRMKNQVTQEFYQQLVTDLPSNEAENTLRMIARQIRAKKLVVKLSLGRNLHAKLYLLHRDDRFNPVIAYLGSSNLTLAGLERQWELNVDVMEGDASKKLVKWFDERWEDRRSIDISEELARIIETSWAREELIDPYLIYLKMAYHLSQEAREGQTEFSIPKDFGNTLFPFQKAAVQIACHHLNTRGGVLIGDVVGLGKTLMATAVAKVFEEDQDLETLIICPKNLTEMWEQYKDQYRLRGKVVSISMVQPELPELRRYRTVIVDESQNLRHRDGQRFKLIKEYIEKNESNCILLSATPYSTSYLDLSSQLRLFVPEDLQLPVRPEKYLREIGAVEFERQHQCAPSTLSGFEKSRYADDWRQLMRLYMVRRTRSFIIENYAETDESNNRKYLAMADGTRSYFPTRVPKTVKFPVAESDPGDQYGRMYSQEVIDAINHLNLPRYGLGSYVDETPARTPTPAEQKQLDDLSQAGKRLMGFCRMNLLKRLESSGAVFLQSLDWHILRNYVYLHALEHGLQLPIGTQDVEVLLSAVRDSDLDVDDILTKQVDSDDTDGSLAEAEGERGPTERYSEAAYRQRAQRVYEGYGGPSKRFKWIASDLFTAELQIDLEADAAALRQVLKACGDWNWRKDTKFAELLGLIERTHPDQKLLIFSQFADTVRYLRDCLRESGVRAFEGVVGTNEHPTAYARRFSPISNKAREQVSAKDELRVLVATDVLSEGQNLQDGHIVVNYDLPWAIVRLIQRAGRVDRIGQQAETILCYSFLPADGVEKLMRLRDRVRQRLKENSEVVGGDEQFFEDDQNNKATRDIYSEKAGIFDGDDGGEVDLASYAYQIWHNATELDTELGKAVEALPAQVLSAKTKRTTETDGVLVFARTASGYDALAWIDNKGNLVTESQLEILQAAECKRETPAQARSAEHHSLVQKGVQTIIETERAAGGSLGRPSGARYKVYTRLSQLVEHMAGDSQDERNLRKALELIYKHPLKETAKDTLNRQLKSSIKDAELAELVGSLFVEERLCQIPDDTDPRDPQIICSLGLTANA